MKSQSPQFGANKERTEVNKKESAMCDGEICEPVTQPRSEGGGGSSGATEQELRVPHIDKVPAENHLTNGAPGTPTVAQVDPLQVAHWAVEDVTRWAIQADHFSKILLECLRLEAIDGEVLLSLTEEDVRDMRYRLGYKLTFGELKKFWLAVLRLQLLVKNSSADSVMLGIESHGGHSAYLPLATSNGPPSSSTCPCPQPECPSTASDCDTYVRMGGRYVTPEYFKTAMSLGESVSHLPSPTAASPFNYEGQLFIDCFSGLIGRVPIVQSFLL